LKEIAMEMQEEVSMGINKEHYMFQEVVTMADVKPYVLRFWETEFDDIKPFIKEDGGKLYHQKDIKIVFLIKQLLFDEKMSIPEAKVAIKQRISEIDSISLNLTDDSKEIAPTENNELEDSTPSEVESSEFSEVASASSDSIPVDEVDSSVINETESTIDLKEEQINEMSLKMSKAKSILEECLDSINSELNKFS
jgi:DNA-binding transcriptional MerR regulator